LIRKGVKEITNSLYSHRFNITDRTALRDLNGLVNKGLLSKKSAKKNHLYLSFMTNEEIKRR